MTSRSSTAVASPVELTALRHPLSASEINALIRVGSGLANFLPSDHRMQLASLGLITVNSRGRLVLTQGGKEQLAEREVRAKHDGGRRLP